MSDFNDNHNTPAENEDISIPKKTARESISVSKRQKMNKRLTTIIDYVELFVISVTVVIVLFTGVFRTCTVDGDSMNNTLTEGEILIVSELLYTPERGDIIVFHQTGDRAIDKNLPLVKRVIGVGGDTVKIDFSTWTVTVTDKDGNSTTLVEDYIYVDKKYPHVLHGTREFVVPEGSLFVLGDNRNHSLDSTDQAIIGFVDERRVIGKVVLRVSPLSKFGGVYQ